jgi:hypothetical protein
VVGKFFVLPVGALPERVCIDRWIGGPPTFILPDAALGIGLFPGPPSAVVRQEQHLEASAVAVIDAFVCRRGLIEASMAPHMGR